MVDFYGINFTSPTELDKNEIERLHKVHGEEQDLFDRLINISCIETTCHHGHVSYKCSMFMEAKHKEKIIDDEIWLKYMNVIVPNYTTCVHWVLYRVCGEEHSLIYPTLFNSDD